MSAEALAKKPQHTHRDGYNCAQAVLLTLYEHMNPKEKNEVIPKIATGFGGGMGRCGSVCGALTGAFMAVGLKYGANEIDAEKESKSLRENPNPLSSNFEKQHGSVMCRDLLKL